MAHDHELADRVRLALKGRRGINEIRMFGGLCFTINGHMCCGVDKNDLMLRLGEEGTLNALQEPHTRPMDFTGKPLKTMIYVTRAGIRDEKSLKSWVDRAATFVRTLPPKNAKQ